MFTQEEQPLLTGSDAEIEAFVDADRCVIVDWRGMEIEAAEAVMPFLPDRALSFEMAYPDAGGVEIRLGYLDRAEVFTLPFHPQNNFRVLLRVARLLEPGYEMALFRGTDGGDTQAFLLRPQEWWAAYRSSHPQQCERIFRPITDLVELWDLEKEAEPVAARPWWKIW
ncbi:MAG: hypothetical protein JWO82_3569 [Akkermansiaceae bacterium]|nr:hypothetical protein [Akkermansiaceae bacterium]